MAFLPLLPLAMALLSVTYVAGQVPGFGKCPTVQVQHDFDLSQYLGLWHEIEKFPFVFEAGKCVTANYTLKSDGHIRVENSENVNGQVQVAVGDAYSPDTKESAKLLVRFYDATPYGDYWVLKTDYKTYTLIWSCGGLLGFGNVQLAWILARERELDPSVIDELHKLAAGYGIDVGHFRKMDQTGCV